MFNPEKLLGKMVKSTMGKGKKGAAKGSFGLGSTAKGALAMGALGVAIAAFDHFTQKQSQASTQHPYPHQPLSPNQQIYPNQPQSPPPQPGAAQTAPPGMNVPPPPPGAPTPQVETPIQADAVLLIKSMIAAANADGVLDKPEREAILGKLTEEELSAEEKQYVTNSFIDPPTLDDIVPNVNSNELAQQVYAVSLMTIRIDTPEEKQYMQQLASRLNLDVETVSRIHSEVASV